MPEIHSEDEKLEQLLANNLPNGCPVTQYETEFPSLQHTTASIETTPETSSTDTESPVPEEEWTLVQETATLLNIVPYVEKKPTSHHIPLRDVAIAGAKTPGFLAKLGPLPPYLHSDTMLATNVNAVLNIIQPWSSKPLPALSNTRRGPGIDGVLAKAGSDLLPFPKESRHDRKSAPPMPNSHHNPNLKTITLNLLHLYRQSCHITDMSEQDMFRNYQFLFRMRSTLNLGKFHSDESLVSFAIFDDANWLNLQLHIHRLNCMLRACLRNEALIAYHHLVEQTKVTHPTPADADLKHEISFLTKHAHNSFRRPGPYSYQILTKQDYDRPYSPPKPVRNRQSEDSSDE